MNDVTPFEGISIEWDSGNLGSRKGIFTVHFESRADYKAMSARLDLGILVFNNQGQGMRLRLRDSDLIEPTTFPSDIPLSVQEELLQEADPREMMFFGNNFLQASERVYAIEFHPPTPEGQDGLLVVTCRDNLAYQQLRRFLDEPHGSSLASLNGRGQWYVNRISDDGNDRGPFPCVVRVRIRWLRLD